LGKDALPGGKEVMNRRWSALGSMSRAEQRVLIVFVAVAIAWITRAFLLEKLIPGLDDTIIAMAGGVALFLLPSDRKFSRRILIWDDAVKLPWGIILLFGGGLALAKAFETSGLATWIGAEMAGLSVLGVFTLILLVVLIVNFLTEFTSNLATVTMILPLLAPIAVVAGIHPYMLMVGATLAASCAFMMPSGTPPNAIAFGSGYLKIWDMAKTGFFLNVVSVILITCTVYFFLELIWGL
jgi:sodium-dependent dicarboxylate transporter 2/3/5